MKSFTLVLLTFMFFFSTACQQSKEKGTAKEPKKESKKTEKSIINKKITEKIQEKAEEEKSLPLNKNTILMMGNVQLSKGEIIRYLSKLEMYASSKMSKEQFARFKQLDMASFEGVELLSSQNHFYLKFKQMNILALYQLLLEVLDPSDVEEALGTKKENIKIKTENGISILKDTGQVSVFFDGKDSYIASMKPEELKTTVFKANKKLLAFIEGIKKSLNIEEKLVKEAQKEPQKESKKEVLSHLSFYREGLFKDVQHVGLAFIQSFKGMSLFSDAHGLTLLVKLNQQSAKEGEAYLQKAYRIYSPMVKQQVHAYLEMLKKREEAKEKGNEKGIQDSVANKDAIEKIAKIFLNVYESIEIKAKGENLYIYMKAQTSEERMILTSLSAMILMQYLPTVMKK